MGDAVIGTVNGVVYIALEEGLKRVMGNKKLFIKLLTKFRTDTKLDGLLDSIKANEMEAARVHAHTLKGVSANLSLQELFLKTQELEAQIKTGTIDPSLTETVTRVFSETMELIDKVIEQYGSS